MKFVRKARRVYALTNSTGEIARNIIVRDDIDPSGIGISSIEDGASVELDFPTVLAGTPKVATATWEDELGEEHSTSVTIR